MKTLIWIFLCATSLASDFRPHVRIIDEGKLSDVYSGVVTQLNNEHYYVLTCGHGSKTKPPSEQNIRVHFVNDLFSIAVKGKIIQVDYDRDLALIEVARYKSINVLPMVIGENPKVGDRCISYGYRDGYQQRVMTVKTLDFFRSIGGNEILECYGNVEQGMSGGALVYDNKVIGILSAKDDFSTTATYAPVIEINEFLENK